MAETVVSRWSKDISKMGGQVSKMESEAAQRWKNNLKALRHAFNSFETKFNNELSNLEGDTRALKKAFEEFAHNFNRDAEELRKSVEALFTHIWGTQADKEAWQRKYGR